MARSTRKVKGAGKGREKYTGPAMVKVLCVECSQWFQDYVSCQQVSNSNVCYACLAREGASIRAALAKRGITLPG